MKEIEMGGWCGDWRLDMLLRRRMLCSNFTVRGGWELACSFIWLKGLTQPPPTGGQGSVDHFLAAMSG